MYRQKALVFERHAGPHKDAANGSSTEEPAADVGRDSAKSELAARISRITVKEWLLNLGATLQTLWVFHVCLTQSPDRTTICVMAACILPNVLAGFCTDDDYPSDAPITARPDDDTR